MDIHNLSIFLKDKCKLFVIFLDLQSSAFKTRNLILLLNEMIIPKLTDEENRTRTINNSAAEFLVIKKLSQIAKERNWIVVKSMRLENHHKKKEGEIDVVIFTQTQGIILLEVKGSQLMIRNGAWLAYNRAEQAWKDIQDPFQQMHDGLFAFELETKSLFSIFRVHPLISWGCVFPETNSIRGTISFPSWRFCTADQFEDLELFLDKLVQKEKGKLSKLGRASHGALEMKVIHSILERLIPTSVEGRFVNLDYNAALLGLEKETEMVHELMRAFSSNNFIFAEGAAGTGKTRAAIFECKRLHIASKCFLFLCRSKLLSTHLEKLLEIELTNSCSQIVSGTELPDDLNLSKFDALIVDEAQDLAHLNNIRNVILQFCHEAKLVRLFGDFDFQNIYSSKTELFQWFSQNQIMVTKSRLSINCRNTTQIGQVISKLANLNQSLFSIGSTIGEIVTLRPNVRVVELKDTVKAFINDWKGKDFPESAITILGYSPEHPIPEDILDFSALKKAVSQDDIEVEGPEFYYAMQFKGLEAPCVIFIVNHLDENWETIFYTAISRARLKCYIIFTEEVMNDQLSTVLCKI